MEILIDENVEVGSNEYIIINVNENDSNQRCNPVDSIFKYTKYCIKFYSIIRLTIYVTFWNQRNDIAEIFNLIVIESMNQAVKFQQKIRMKTLILVLTIFILTISFTAMFFLGKIENIFRYFSQIYSSIITLNILLIYYVSICGYEIMIVSFFAQNILPIGENIPLIRQWLLIIKSLHMQIEKILGFIIFWIFILNFIEVIATVVAPHFEHRLKFINALYMVILRSSFNFTALLTVVFKVDAVSRNPTVGWQKIVTTVMKENPLSTRRSNHGFFN